MTRDGVESAATEAQPALPARVAALKAEHLHGKTLASRAKSPAGGKVVSVDCTKGQSVQAAVDSADSPLVVEIHGICQENVRIDHKTVTLRGVDPATDGLRGMPADPSVPAAVTVFYADGVSLENLSVDDGPQTGVGIWFSHVTMENCWIRGNATIGIHVSSAGFLDGYDLTVAENGTRGLQARRSGAAFCTGCTFQDNRGYAGASSFGGILSLLDSVVTGPGGLISNLDSYADVDCLTAGTGHPCSLTASFRAAVAADGAIAVLYGAGDFAGQLLGVDRGEILLYGARQIAPGMNGGSPVPNRLTSFAVLDVEPFVDGLGVVHGSKLLGDTQVGTFSRALLFAPMDLEGTLRCDSAGDAWDDGATLAPGSSIADCEHAPPPSP